MRKKFKIIDLLNKIANGEEVPKYIQYYNMLKDKTDTMMVCKENLIYKLDQLEISLNDEVEILDDEEDKDIPLIPDDELWKFDGKPFTASSMRHPLDYNFKVLKEKINQVVKEFNEYRKEVNKDE